MTAPALDDILLCLKNAIKTIEAKEYFDSVVSRFLTSGLEQNANLLYRAKECLKNITTIYMEKLRETDRPDWGDECYRCTYVYRFFAGHSYMVYQSLQLALAGKERLTWNKKSSFRVCCIGGGPGSDALGLTKFLRDTGLVATNRLECSIFDLHREWEDTWHMIKGSNACSDEFPLMTYFSGDMTRTGVVGLSSDELLKVRSADVVSFVKFFSTVEDSIRKDSSRGNLLREIFTELKPGALVLYIDNCYGNTHTEFKNIAISGGVTDTLFERQQQKLWMQSEARRSEVMTRFDQMVFSKFRLRKNYDVSVMLLKKPCDDTTDVSISTSPTLLHPEADCAFPERRATPMVTTGEVTMPLKVRCKPRYKCSCRFTPYWW